MKSYLRNWVIVILLVVAVFAFCSRTSGQEEKPLKVETNLVTLNVSVTDTKGKFVGDLSRDRFSLFDDKVKQEIAFFSAETAPIFYGIIYDMHPTTPDQSTIVLSALRKFTRELPKKDNFFFIAFNERKSIDLDFVPAYADLWKIINSGQGNKPNSLYDVVYAMADKLRPRKEGKQVMLILGDGANHFSHHSFDELSKRLRSVNLPLYAVLLESDWEPFWTYSDIWRYPRSRRRYPGPFDPTRLEIASLEDIAQRSGGDTYTPQFLSSAALYDTCREIAAEIESQYMLGFYSEKADGKWHKIKVSVRSADGKKLKVSHRKGYQATQRN